MKGNLFVKLGSQTSSKNKPKFLNVTFLNNFCICSIKNWGKWCVYVNKSYSTYFWHSLCRKLTKSYMALGKYSLMQYDLYNYDLYLYLSWYTTFLAGHFSEDWNLLVFLSYTELQKEVRFLKNWLLLKF